MRRLVVLSLALLLAACWGEAPAYRSNALEEVQKRLDLVFSYGGLAVNFAHAVPRYETLFRENLTKRAAGELHVDFIAMVHELSGVDASEKATMERIVAQSQAQVKWLLEQLNPQIASMEEVFSERASRAVYVSNSAELERAVLSDLGSASASSSSERVPVSGVLDYLAAHPNAWVIGGEDRELLFFSVEIGLIAQGLSDDNLLNLYGLLNHFRSDVAVAKLIDTLRKNGRKHGVIVFGGGHMDDFHKIAQALDLSATFYCAGGEKPLAQLTLEDLRC